MLGIDELAPTPEWELEEAPGVVGREAPGVAGREAPGVEGSDELLLTELLPLDRNRL